MGLHLGSFWSNFHYFLHILGEMCHPSDLTTVSHFCLILGIRASPKPTPGPSKCVLKRSPEFTKKYVRFLSQKVTQSEPIGPQSDLKMTSKSMLLEVILQNRSQGGPRVPFWSILETFGKASGRLLVSIWWDMCYLLCSFCMCWVLLVSATIHKYFSTLVTQPFFGTFLGTFL